MAVSRLSKVFGSQLFLVLAERDSLRNAIHFIPKNRWAPHFELQEIEIDFQ